MYLSEARNRKIEEVKQLKFYSRNKDWEEDLSKYTEVQEIEISFWNDEQPNLPRGIEQLQKLEKISFSYCALKSMPEGLAKLKQLKVLSFGLKCQLKEIPNWISNFEQLEILDLNDNKIDHIPLEVAKLHKLKQLHLYNNRLKELPEELSKLEHLEILDVARNQLSKLPQYLGKFRKLRKLYFNSNQIKRLPQSLKNCDKMEVMHWHNNKIAAQDLLKILSHFPNLITQKMYKGKELEIANLAKEIQTLSPDEEYLSKIINLYLDKPLKEEITDAELLRIAALKDRSNTSRKAIRILTDRQKAKLVQKPIKAGSTIVIVGKTNFKKKQTAQELKKLGIHYQSKIKNDCSHLILGPAVDFTEAEIRMILNNGVVILKESDFLEIYNQLTSPYLIEGAKEAPEQAQNIGALLLSQDESNQEIALEMIKSGGLPKDLITELFIFYAYIAEKKNRQKARKLLLLYGSDALKNALRKKYQKLSSRGTDALYEFTEGTELIQWKINQYVFLRLNYWYLHNQKNNLIQDTFQQAPKEIGEAFILEVFHKWSKKYNSLSWPWTLDFNLLGAYVFELDYLEAFLLVVNEFGKYPVKKFPKGLSKLKQLKRLTLQFDLSFLDHSPPEEIFQLEELTELSLFKCNLKTLPDQFASLEKLEQLTLSSNQLQALPESIFKLKHLRIISIQKAFAENVDANYWKERIEKQFPKAKILF
jgi:Leucine-rich repeat (LRR) protein